MMPRWRLHVGLALTMFAPAARAQAPAVSGPTRHVAVLVDAAPDVDAFTKMYLYEVISGRLQQHGFAVTAADPADTSEPPLACVASEACRRPMMEALDAPWLIALRLEVSGEGRLRASLRSSHGAASLDAEDEEAGIATALDRTLRAQDPSRLPCLVRLESAVAGTRLRLHGESTPLPSLLAAGQHEAELEAPGREPWRGPLQCGGAGVLRLHVR